MKSKCLIVSALLFLAGFLPQSKAQTNLGSAGSFAVYGSSAVTSTGSTVVNGNLGAGALSSITGFGPTLGTVNGMTYNDDAVTTQVQTDATAAFTYLKGETSTGSLMMNLGGLTLLPGVYSASAAAQLTGVLTLNGPGDYVFQIGGALTTAAASSIVLENGATAADVFWEVGTAATIGADTSFDGAVLAGTSITLGNGASLTGNALALDGAVTLDDNNISVPAAPATVPDSMGTGAMLAGVLLFVFGAKKFGLQSDPMPKSFI